MLATPLKLNGIIRKKIIRNACKVTLILYRLRLSIEIYLTPIENNTRRMIIEKRVPTRPVLIETNR